MRRQRHSISINILYKINALICILHTLDPFSRIAIAIKKLNQIIIMPDGGKLQKILFCNTI
jgi:hypothetical protein